MADIKDLKKRAEEIRDERAPGANTAERIGKWNLDAAELIGELKSFIDQFVEKKIKIDYNDLENKPLIWEMIPAGDEYLDENGDPIMIPIVRLPDNTPIDLGDIYRVVFSRTKQKLDDILAGKVNKEEGKGLSTNDFTNEDRTKLSELETAVGNKYEKPSEGIPSTDLEEGLRNSIGRADEIYNDYILSQELI